MFDAIDLANMRADLASILLDVCTFKGRTGTTLASNVPCSITVDTTAMRSGANMELNMGMTTFILTVPYVIYLDAQPTVEMALIADLRVIHGGHTYEIDEILDDQTPLVFRQLKMAKVST